MVTVAHSERHVRLPSEWTSAERSRLIAKYEALIRPRFDTGPVSHKMLAGLDILAIGASGDGFDPRPFDLYAPTYFGVEPLALVDEPDLKQRQTGIYLQDQMHLGPWIVLAGIRRDWVSSKSEETLMQSDKATTGRIGPMYEFANGLSPYLSYAQWFNPISAPTSARADPASRCEASRSKSA